MRLDPATSRSRQPAVLLLHNKGSRAVEQVISRNLQKEGFKVLLQSEVGVSIPQPGITNSTEELRTSLKLITEKFAIHSLHPGVSSWADRPELPLIGNELGIEVISPPAKVLSLFINKLNFFAQAEEIGIPNLLLHPDPIHSIREVENLVGKGVARFPFVLKAVKGGGGLGVIVINDQDDLERRLPLWLEQLQRNLGEAIFFAERFLEDCRHIAVPFARLWDGRCEIFSPIDVSLQSGCRKIIEFCPAPKLEPKNEAILKDWVRKIAEKTGFLGLGVIEFLVDGSRAYLVEGLARLNTGFYLWQQIDGTNPISWQLSAMKSGKSGTLPCRSPDASIAFGLLLRFYAEDPILQLPQPGSVYAVSKKRNWNLPGAIAELIPGLSDNSVVTPFDDGLLGILFIGSNDYKKAVTFSRGVLSEIWIAGGLQTNERFLSELLQHPWVSEGIFHAGFVDQDFIPKIKPPAEFLGFFVNLCLPPDQRHKEYRWAVGDQWVKPDQTPLNWTSPPVCFQEEGEFGQFGMLELPSGQKLFCGSFPLKPDRWQVRIGSWILNVRRFPPKVIKSQIVKKTYPLLALVTGKVHSILYQRGSIVPAHDNVILIESLRTLVPHALPVDARIVEWKVMAEDIARAGDELGTIEKLDTPEN